MDYNECIKFTGNVIKDLPDIPEEKQKQYLKALGDINQRKNNPYLNVAVIGDFSTGKSTFINALIKQNILKTAWLATTAVQTQIYYHGENRVVVKLEAQNGEKYDLSVESDRRKLERYLNYSLPEDIKDLIASLTTSNRFAEKIKLTKIYCPSDIAFKEICIIDTPGVNPGAGDTKSHVMATRNVLREYADATIVLFQARSVFTNSFKTFLEENAKHFMDEAVFVITMMDIVDDEERTEIIEFVGRSLKEAFGLDNPLVFGCCAKYMNEKTVNAEEQEWCLEFDRLRRELAAYINRRRDIIIRKQMSLLLNNILKPLDQDIEGNIAKIERELDILKKNSIENMEAELDANRSKYQRMVDSEFEKGDVEAKYNKMFSKIIDSASESINCCTEINGKGNSAINGYMGSGLSAVMEKEQKKLSKKVNKLFSRIEEILRDYYSDNEEVFQKYSVNLGKIGNVVIEGDKMGSDAMNLGKVTFNGDSGSFIGDGMAVAVMLAGGIAALPFAFLDGLLDTDISDTIFGVAESFADRLVNFFGDISAKKREAIASVKRSVDKMRDENREKFLEQVEDRKRQVQNAIEEIETRFKEEYQSVYQTKQQAFLAEKARMEKEIDTNQGIHQKLTGYLAELAQNRQEEY